jgi:hypothetical protein
VALLATTAGLVVLVQDRADARRELASLRQQLETQQGGGAAPPASSPQPGGSSRKGDGPQAPQGDAPQSDGPQGDAPQGDAPAPKGDAPQSNDQSNPLDNLLGGSGAPNLDPACLGLDSSNPLNGLKGNPIDGTVEQQVTKISALVENERGLRFKHPVKPEFLASKDFDQRLAKNVDSEYSASQADIDGRVLSLLGAVPKGTDMKALQSELMTGQVAGYYDPESGDIVVRVPDGGGSLDGEGQVTLAHELDHALTDQALVLPDSEQKGQSDSDLARLALVEGDATLLMEQFSMKSLGLLGQLGGALSPDALQAQRQLEETPAYMQRQLMFPYITGLEYTCRLYKAGGWPGVDIAYKLLPRTSAEVMFPEESGMVPKDPKDPATLTGGWKVAQKDTIGAAQLLWLMQAPGGNERKGLDQPLDAVRHWAGGELVLSTKGDQSALGVALVDNQDGGALCSAVENWYQAAFSTSRSQDGDAVVMNGEGQVGVARCAGRDVRLGIAPDLATATKLAG